MSSLAKIKTPTRLQRRVRNTTTRKDINVNDATRALLELCTSTNSIPEIINQLSEQSGEPGAEITESVYKILTVLKEKNIITVHAVPSKTGRKVKKLR